MPRQAYRISLKLPPPRYAGSVSIEEGLLKRRSIRGYTQKSLTLDELSQLLWAAQGITDSMGLRTAPSAGTLYPLEVYVVIGDVNGLRPGIYKYQPQGHVLVNVGDGDLRFEIAKACFGQLWMQDSAAIIVFSAVYERTTKKYGRRGVQYVHMEAGHAAQNIALQAVSLHLGTVVVGAFDDEKIKEKMKLSEEETPLCLMPVGKI